MVEIILYGFTALCALLLLAIIGGIAWLWVLEKRNAR